MLNDPTPPKTFAFQQIAFFQVSEDRVLLQGYESVESYLLLSEFLEKMS